MAKDPAFLLYYKDILVSCASWDADELGWYFRLLCHQADKPDGLDSDIETLAGLANVKFSQFERFKLCWERRLKAKFQANPQGLILNKVQEEIINKRREYSERQSVKGIIGYFIKITKRHHTLDEEQSKNLIKELEKQDLLLKTKEERFSCYQAVLVALLGNAIAIAIINTIETEYASPEKNQASKIHHPQRKSILTGGVTFGDGAN